MRDLVAGQNVPLQAGPVPISVSGIVALGRIYGIAVVPEGADAWLSLQDQPGGLVAERAEGTLSLDPSVLPPSCQRVHVGIYARRGAATMRGFVPASFEIAGHAVSIEADPVGAAFMVFAEVYRRDGAWRLRARSDMSRAGLEDFAHRHGSRAVDASPPVVSAPGRGDAPFPAPGRGGDDRRGDAWSGSSFLVAPGIVATNAHVVEGASTILAVGDDGRYEAEPVLSDPGADLALVRIRGAGAAPTLRLRPGFDLSAGETVFALGFPLGGFLGAGPQITQGMISNGLGPANDTRLLQITAPIQPGSSGGPILDAAGDLVGVAVSSVAGAQNVNFAVRASLLAYLSQAAGFDAGTGEPPSGGPSDPARILRHHRRTLYRLECNS